MGVLEQDSWCKAVRALDDSCDEWINRTTVTLDFSQGFATYLEKITFDIETTVVSNITSSSDEGLDAHLIPLGWRRRETFLAFDCKTNSGESLQLLPLRKRQMYCEWIFWEVCKECSLLTDREPHADLKALVKSYVESGEGEEKALSKMTHALREQWAKIRGNSVASELFERIGEYQPLILSATNIRDLAIIKLHEVKQLSRPSRRSMYDRYLARFSGTISSMGASSTKFIAPSDCRFMDVQGTVRVAKGAEAVKVAAKLHGQGSWAFSSEKVRSSSVQWNITFASRRSHFIAPAMRTHIASLITVLFWFLGNFNAATPSVLLNSYSMALISAYFIYHFRLFGQNSQQSVQFQWGIKLHRYLLMMSMVATALFPVTAHFVHRVDAFQVSLFSLLNPEFDNSQNVQYFANLVTRGSPTLGIKWIILIYLALMTWNYIDIYRFSRPAE